MSIDPPPERPDQPGMRATYAQDDFDLSAQRSRFRKDQLFTPSGPNPDGPVPYGEGGFPAGGEGQSGYGTDFGQLDGAERHEKAVSEQDNLEARRESGTCVESDR